MNRPNDNTLVDLLSRARDGDHDCLNRAFAECRSFLYLAARTRLESWLQAKVDASDLVQQTLLEAYRDFSKYRGATEAEWYAWLRQILAHNAANYARHYRDAEKRCVAKEVHLPVEPHCSNTPHLQLSAKGETPSQSLIRKERELQLADAIAQLSPEHQEVIILRNLQRLSFQQVAERMQRSRSAVQMLWMRALAKLKEELAPLQSKLFDT